MAENLPFDELLLKYIDEELPSSERTAFEELLNKNPDLKKKLEGLELA